MLFNITFQCLASRSGVADIETEQASMTSRCFDIGDGLLSPGLVAGIVRNYAKSILRKADGNRPADTGTRSRYQDGILRVSH
jgi:hypothetical protein